MTATTSALDAILADTEPLTEDQVAISLRIISRRAWDVAKEHNQTSRRLGEVEAEAARIRTTALIESHVEHPDRRVALHEAIADKAAEKELAEVFLLTRMERSLRHEMSVLEKLVSALQTAAADYRARNAA